MEYLLTNENYFEDTHFMSVSSFKRFQKCELGGKQPWGTPSDAMMVGSYVDAYIEGTLEKFKVETPQIFTTTIKENEFTVEGIRKLDPTFISKTDKLMASKVAEAKKLFPQCFTTVTNLKSEFQKADEICKYIDADKTFSQFMSGDKQTIMTGVIGDVPFKIKMDSYSKGIAINDLKVMRTVTDSKGNFYDFITPWGYDVQLACYQEIVRQNTGEKLLCYICAVTKETPINSVIINIPQVFLDRALYNVESNVKHYYEVMQGHVEPIGCGVCPSCISARKSTQIISLQDIIEGGM